MKYKKKGFTLSEVLITLVIIGVIAAVAIPQLHNNYRRTETETRLQKAFSVINQAAVTASAQGNDWESWLINAGNTSNWANIDEEKDFFNNYFRPYIRKIAEEDWGTQNINFYLADGTRILIGKGGCLDFTVDVNGEKGPNAYGSDWFVYDFCPYSVDPNAVTTGIPTPDQPPTGKLIPYGMKNNSTLSSVKSTCESDVTQCAAWIMMNGWKIPKNYPHQL